ncbi:hypothetical protein K439DRAFT_1273292, partial [Ramaria rubella]
KIHFGDNSFAEAPGTGTVCFISKSSGKAKRVTLTNVLHVPTFLLTLVSVHHLAKSNYISVFGERTCRVIQPLSCKIHILGNHKNGLYRLNMEPI